MNFDGECGCRLRCDRQRGLLKLSGVAGYKVFTFSGCESNLEFALRMRFMRDLPPISPESWIKFEPYALSVIQDLCLRQPFHFTRRNLFERWVLRYDLNKRNCLKLWHDEPETNEKFLFKASACVKYEINIESDKPLKPRAFFPKHHTNLATNGPLMWFIKHKLGYIFDGLRCPLLFGSGYSNRSLGDQFGKVLSTKNSDLVAVELDLSMCETTMRGPFLGIERQLYRGLGLSHSECDFLLKHPLSFGSSSKRHLKFQMPFCRESGTANTTVGNTVVFGICLLAVMRMFGCLDRQWFSLVGGDDACIYCERQLVPKVRAVVDFISTLGLKPEALYHDSVYAGRFYGGRMLQVLENGVLRWCHCPLIGRALCKNNCVKFQGNRNPLLWLRDVTIGRTFEWSHMPLLRSMNSSIKTMNFGTGINRIPLPYRDINCDSIVMQPAYVTYMQLADVYGCSVDDLIDADHYLASFFLGDWFGKDLDHYILKSICDVDLK